MTSSACKFILYAVALLFVTLCVSVSLPRQVAALNGGDFNPARIIDDGVFYNDNSMTVSQIQAFLNSKVTACDTNGDQNYSYYFNSATGEVNNDNDAWDGDAWVTTKRSVYGDRVANYLGENRGSRAPYTCLKDIRFNTDNTVNSDSDPNLCNGYTGGNNESAATVIYKVAQSCNINPQVMMVLLQKEQSLITDTWPFGQQYTKATGYNCPDSTLPVSEDANGNNCRDWSEGFFKQVYYSARQFKLYRLNAANYNYRAARNNIIYWHPNAACGTSNVYIENQATAALYIYTPYRPNQAALNNLYGTGDGCSSYGNRNFWRMFNDWFGSTLGGVMAEPHAVWRLYNPSTGGHVLTASADEANQYINQGLKSDGVATHSVNSGGVPVYRLWNGRTHFFTSKTSERDAYVAAGWKNDGEIFKAATSGKPVWRLWNERSRSHFVTSSPTEMSSYVRAGWRSDGIVFYEQINNVSPVWRLYNPNTGGHFLTAKPDELTAYIALGWKSDGVTLSSTPDGVPVYRLWNGRSHFFTISTSERDAYIAAGWKNDGEIFKTEATGTPVYRLYSGSSRTHFFTSKTSERDAYIAAGWKNDGVVFYTTNTVAVRRLYQPTTGSHMVVSDISVLWRNTKEGWQDDGLLFYASTSLGNPVYQLYSSAANSYFYTISTSERNSYISAGWRNDGIALYAPTTGAPVYRLFNPSNNTHILVVNTAERTAYVNAGWVNDGMVFNGSTTAQ